MGSKGKGHGAVNERFMKHHYGASGYVKEPPKPVELETDPEAIAKRIAYMNSLRKLPREVNYRRIKEVEESLRFFSASEAFGPSERRSILSACDELRAALNDESESESLQSPEYEDARKILIEIDRLRYEHNKILALMNWKICP